MSKRLAVVLALVSAAVTMWLGAFLFESPIKVPQLGLTWVALLFLGILGSGFAFVLCYYLIHEIGPTRTSMVTYLFPLGGVNTGKWRFLKSIWMSILSAISWLRFTASASLWLNICLSCAPRCARLRSSTPGPSSTVIEPETTSRRFNRPR